MNVPMEEKRMNVPTDPTTTCKEQEIPIEIKRFEILIENTFELLKQLEGRIEPILGVHCDKVTENNKDVSLESPIGKWLNLQNEKLEKINYDLDIFSQRVKL